MKKFFLLLCSLTIVFSAGCGASAQKQIPEETTATARAAAKAVTAPGFTLAKLGGGNVAVVPEKDGKLYVLNFWATWCPPCRQELPDINTFAEKYGRTLAFYGINLDEPEGTVKEFMEKNKLTFPVLLDKGGKAARQYQVRAIPTTYIVDRKGVVRFHKVGMTSLQELEQAVKAIQAGQ